MFRFIPRAIDTFDKFVYLSGNRSRHAENSHSHTNIQRRKAHNYRPISVSQFFSKIYEKIVATYVIEFLEDNSVFYNYEFGFRKNNSTSDAIITLVERVFNAPD